MELAEAKEVIKMNHDKMFICPRPYLLEDWLDEQNAKDMAELAGKIKRVRFNYKELIEVVERLAPVDMQRELLSKAIDVVLR